jgi:hypothetical protein
MNVHELRLHRDEILQDSVNEDGFISDSSFLNESMLYLNETKLTDTDNVNESYCVIDGLWIKINGYVISESGERLQLFIVNEASLSPVGADAEILISQKQIYEKLFSKAINFVKKAGKSQLDEELQDSSPAKTLAVFLASVDGMENIDVVEVFLISATITVEPRGEEPTPRRMEFEDEIISVTWMAGRNKIQKEITVIKRLIDINFLYEVSASQGNRLPLEVDFSDYHIECIQAAAEQNYESYLCVLPASLLVKLYHKDGSRMLEKNVRSFLQLKNNVNKGIQDTIRNNPEKFIAYNNGLTITATGKQLRSESGKIFIQKLTDFQIVNGGQTTATIYFSDKAGLDISKVKVMAKINVAKEASEEELEDLIVRISEYSNAQSRVSPVDLRSRNSQLVRLKNLSESTLTPSGKKWFFERAKGEFNTMVRKDPKKKGKLEKEFPRERRFTKEELAKYFTAWGENPHLVKKGGEKVFRLFIENISGDGKLGKQLTMDRTFYEETIAKIILFRSLEKLHGSGSDAIGQLRSAVVPYSLSILYRCSTGDASNYPFKLTEIWKKEGLDEPLLKLMHNLMVLMNGLIKKYAESDDYGEYSKKPELWNKIKSCSEIRQFVKEDAFGKIIKRYCSRPADSKPEGNLLKHEIDFGPLYNSVDFFSSNKKESTRLKKAVDFIVTQYNKAVGNGESITSAFMTLRKLAATKGVSDAVIFSKIGRILDEGRLPDLEHIQKAAAYTDIIK